MKNRDQLFDIIHSLTGREKGYFKRFAQLHSSGPRDYIKLFDLLDSQKEYDEPRLIKKMGAKYAGNKLSVTKYYLKNLITKSMRAYYSEDNEYRKVSELIDEMDFYYKKGLYSQLEKTINRAEKLALEFELFPELLRIKWWKRRLFYLQGKRDEVLQTIEERREYLELMKNDFEYEELTHKIQLLINEKVPSKDNESFYNNILQEAMLKDIKHARSFRAKENFYSIHLTSADALHDHELRYKYSKEMVELYEENPQFISSGYSRYIYPYLMNLMMSQHGSRRYDEFLESMAKIRTEIDKNSGGLSDQTNLMLMANTFSYEMWYYYNIGDLENSLNVAQSAIKYYEEKKPEVQVFSATYMILFFSTAVTFFSLKDYKNALLWIRKVLATVGFEKHRPDVYSAAKIFYLIIHSELGNQELLIHAFRSTYRYLKKKSALGNFESIVLNHLRKLPKVKDNSELNMVYKSLRDELITIKKDPYAEDALKSYKIISWLESKIERRRLKEIIIEKAKTGDEF